MGKEMNWKNYEQEIFEEFRTAYPDADIQLNAKILGRFSKIERQIDVLIEDYAAGHRFRIIVDGKYFSKKVDVKTVESFLGMLADVEAHKGLIISQIGYSDAALSRAHNDPIDIELDILNFEKLSKFQGVNAIPYVNNMAIALPAPFGWVIDINCPKPFLCYLYQRGLTQDEAINKLEFMYVDFWDKRKDKMNIDRLITMQNEQILATYPDAKFELMSSIKRKDADTRIRVADIPAYGGLEITGYVEFQEFIFFCVLLTPHELRKKNFRKLEYILAKIKPFDLKFDNALVLEQSIKELEATDDMVKKRELAHQIARWYREMGDTKNAEKYLNLFK